MRIRRREGQKEGTTRLLRGARVWLTRSSWASGMTWEYLLRVPVGQIFLDMFAKFSGCVTFCLASRIGFQNGLKFAALQTQSQGQRTHDCWFVGRNLSCGFQCFVVHGSS